MKTTTQTNYDADPIWPMTLRMYDDDDDTNPLRCRSAMTRYAEDIQLG
jgi:hypothetical protein